MKRIVKIGHCLAAAALLCGCSKPAATGADAAGEHTTPMIELPLQRGFYVSADTACEEAANATLLLLRRDGFNGARDSCDFKSVEQTGPHEYRVIEQCDTTQTVVWQVPDDENFSSKSDSGWERSFRYCEQSRLPDPWRDNDISDLIE